MVRELQQHAFKAFFFTCSQKCAGSVSENFSYNVRSVFSYVISSRSFIDKCPKEMLSENGFRTQSVGFKLHPRKDFNFSIPIAPSVSLSKPSSKTGSHITRLRVRWQVSSPNFTVFHDTPTKDRGTPGCLDTHFPEHWTRK